MRNRDSHSRLTAGQIAAFEEYLRTEERERTTIEKYLRNIRDFAAWLGGEPVTKPAVVAWKEHLLAKQYAPATVNAALASLNAFFKFAGWEECRVKALRLQRRIFRDPDRELTRDDYDRLIRAAYENGKTRLGLLMETICATGIRVSEVKYITVEAAQRGKTEISLKGKIRTIMLPGKLCRKLLKYAKKQKTVSGEIFLTRNGKGLSRRQIWAEMKTVCKAAGVAPSKVFPHNLRHLFAKVYCRVYRDIVKLADILGHSNIGTTRIYLISTGAEHAEHTKKQREQLDAMGMVWKKPDPWEVRYALAKVYFEEHGNLKVSRQYKPDGICLSKWLNEQRQVYIGNRPGKTLTREQIARLEVIGMTWGKQAHPEESQKPRTVRRRRTRTGAEVHEAV